MIRLAYLAVAMATIVGCVSPDGHSVPASLYNRVSQSFFRWRGIAGAWAVLIQIQNKASRLSSRIFVIMRSAKRRRLNTSKPQHLKTSNFQTFTPSNFQTFTPQLKPRRGDGLRRGEGGTGAVRSTSRSTSPWRTSRILSSAPDCSRASSGESGTVSTASRPVAST